MSVASYCRRLVVLLVLPAAIGSPTAAEPTTPAAHSPNLGGGAIEGTVTDALTGEPLGATVELYRTDYTLLWSVHTDSTGGYSLTGLPAGSYLILTKAAGYIIEAYDDILCHPQRGCDMSPEITRITVTEGSTTSGIDIALHPGATITGRMTSATTGEPISITLVIYDPVARYLVETFSSLTGEYASGLMPAGTYYVRTESQEHQNELYDDVPCPLQIGCDWFDGTPIEFDWGQAIGGIDLALDRLGAISGTVSQRTTGEPIEGAMIFIRKETGNPHLYTMSSSTGTYLVEMLPPGNYTARVQDDYHQGELYDDIPCEGCDPAAGTPIAVDLNAVTGDIDFALERLAEISGRVTHSVTGQPLEFVDVEVYDASGALIGSGETDTSGDYAVQGLPPGQHFAVATGVLYLDQLYDGLPCEGGCDPTAGMPIAASLNTVTAGIDFALDQLGSIGGRVLHDGQPVAGARVVIYDGSGGYQRDAFTDSEGNYVAGILPSGTYFAIAEHDQLNDELYDNLPCEGGCDPATGTPIHVNINSTTQDVDFDLGYCTPTATSLCLTGDRFRVEALWEDFENATGPGFAEELTADAGTFWFFTPGNIELVVKVLDVCIEPHNRFWVFGAGLTDVGVELKVTDELTGDVVIYDNTLGTPYVPVLDTLAFDTCDAGLGNAVAGSPKASRRGPPLQAAPEKGECVPGATRLCLNGGRFSAEVEWLAPNGNGGPAPVVPLTDETGYFYFGGPDNVEVVVKVLDACALPSFNNYWVFAAGLTNFEVTLTVTDTVSDEVQVYTNAQGTTFEAITDTGHFMTCP